MKKSLTPTEEKILRADIPGFDTLAEKEKSKYRNRVLSGEPIQYVTGIAPFFGYFFEVNPSVLIPRPETEELVYEVQKFLNKISKDHLRIIDIGTGSGCIPVTLSLLFPKAEITAIDVSADALDVARKNNEKLGATVSFAQADILEWGTLAWDAYDIIISNPPYIPSREKALMEVNVLDHEPHLALFVENENPLVFYKRIFSFCKSNLSANGVVFLECNEYNATEVMSLFKEVGAASIIKDMQGKDRIVFAST